MSNARAAVNPPLVRRRLRGKQAAPAFDPPAEGRGPPQTAREVRQPARKGRDEVSGPGIKRRPAARREPAIKRRPAVRTTRSSERRQRPEDPCWTAGLSLESSASTAAWAILADDAKTEVIAWLGGPCSMPLLIASRGESALLNLVQDSRRRLHAALKVLWTRPLSWPLLKQPALAEVHWSSRRTGHYCAEALRYWLLNWRTKWNILVEAITPEDFWHTLCAAENYQVDVLLAAQAMLAGRWRARYFRSYQHPRNFKCLLLQFQGGIFEGSLFVEVLESDSEEETLSDSS